MSTNKELIKSNQIPQFVKWLRSVAPYVHLFKDKVFVIAFSGQLIQEKKLDSIIQDIALLNAMGVKIVVVYGSKPQIDEQLRLREYKSNFKNGIRISDNLVMEYVKKAAGEIRLDIEASFSSGLPNTPMGNSSIRVISGNFLIAKPLGIHNGIDYKLTGVVRKVEKDSIIHSLSKGAIVLLPPLGFSPTGEAFNLSFEDVSSSVAIELGAEKLIFVINNNSIPHQINSEPIEISCQTAKTIIKENKTLDKDDVTLLNAVKSCEGGVNRVHLLPYHRDGVILLELFTHSGIGTMIVEKNLESIRSAGLNDIGAILDLIKPYEKDGTLKFRDRHLIEQEINNFTVIEHDGVISGCVSLTPYPKTFSAELGCLIVSKNFQGNGEGRKLLINAEKKAIQLGLHSIFVLTTIATHWFLKMGFIEISSDQIPKEKNVDTNFYRGSKILQKKLSPFL